MVRNELKGFLVFGSDYLLGFGTPSSDTFDTKNQRQKNDSPSPASGFRFYHYFRDLPALPQDAGRPAPIPPEQVQVPSQNTSFRRRQAEE
ncbi:hypothetical protein [Rhodoferax sp. OV413]|uniref:hypothetical protein n=1 Tax=Rhodoferax sp. OV413 TaxID=1855285 RepID=UPI00115F9F53|nr:hypothetical protein [Rhodoferax sp. OV413]